MNQIVQAAQVALPARLAEYRAKHGLTNSNQDLTTGVGGGFAVVSIRGKAFHVKFAGEERTLMRDDGDGARGSIEVVLLKATPKIGKIYYKNGYTDGSNAPPDCWSADGVMPDKSVVTKQAATCAACPYNAWGSKVTSDGKQGKACADSRRLAIVPLGDMQNEAFGGPMLLRVPAASLKELATLSSELDSLGFDYFAVATRISFDTNEAFPKLKFKAMRVLTDAELEASLTLRDDPRTQRVLSEEEQPLAVAAQPAAPPAPTVQTVFEQPPAPVQAAPVQAAPVQAPPAPQPMQVAPQPVQAPAAEPIMPGNLDAMLDSLLIPAK